MKSGRHLSAVQRVIAQGAELAVDVDGNSPVALILVHGGPGAPADFAFVRGLLRQRGISCARYDQRGVHRSTCLDRRWGIASHAADLEAIRRQVGADKIAVLGHSFGGLVAQAWAKAYPERVKALLLSSPLMVVGDDYRRAMRHVTQCVLAGLAPSQRLRLALADMKSRLPGSLGDRGSAEVYGLVLRSYTGAEPPGWVAHCSAAATARTRKAIEVDSYEAVEPLELPASVPVRIAFGDRDIHPPLAFDKAHRIARSQVEHFDECGHVLWHDRPARFEQWLDQGLRQAGLDGRSPDTPYR